MTVMLMFGELIVLPAPLPCFPSMTLPMSSNAPSPFVVVAFFYTQTNMQTHINSEAHWLESCDKPADAGFET